MNGILEKVFASRPKDSGEIGTERGPQKQS